MRKSICFMASLAIIAVGAIAGASYITGVYKDQGGNRMIVASTGSVVIESGGALSSAGDVSISGTLTLASTDNATLSARNATADDGMVWYCSDCAAGSPILVFSNGTAYVRSDTGAAISAE
jgi:hypothetical protein